MIIPLPKSISFRLVSLVTLLCLFLSCVSWTVWSPQAAGTPAPQSRTAMRTFAPFWRIGNGYSSALIVRNTSKESSTRATPIIFTADKKQIRLPAIELAPGEVKRIYLEEALPAAGSSADSGALAVQIDQSQSATVIGEVVITNYQQGIIFDIPLHAGYAGSDAKTLHSSWWLPDDKTQGKIILFNASEQAIVAHPSITTNVSQHSFANVNLAPHESKKLDLREMIQQTEDNGADRGSITISYDGPQQALLPALLLFNSRNGFSLANRFFAKHSQPPNLAGTINWYYPLVVTGKGNPALGFQRESKFTAFALISNPTSTMITPRLTATFTPESGASQGVNLPVSPLPPMTTSLVDLSDLAWGSLPRNASSFSLQVSHEGATGDLAIHVFSVDHKKDFVFTAEGTAQLRNRLDSIYWNIADDLQSLLVLQNAGDNSLQAQATLTYDISDGRTQKYKLPVLGLAARATRLVNLRQIITAGQPDEAGQVIPPGTNFGTVTIEAVAGQHSDALVGGNVSLDPDSGTCGGDVLPICDHERIEGEDCDILPDTCEPFCGGDPPCAVPTNFRQTAGSDAGAGTLHFDYAWDSNTGDVADLWQCEFEEIVSYNPTDLPFPSPPFKSGLYPPNPTTVSGPMTGGVVADNHSTPGPFVTPYSARTIIASQVYRYSCPCTNGGSPVIITGHLTSLGRSTKMATGRGNLSSLKTMFRPRLTRSLDSAWIPIGYGCEDKALL